MTSSWFGWRWNACACPASNAASTVTIDASPSAGPLTIAAGPRSDGSYTRSACVLNAPPPTLSPLGDRLEAAHVLGHRDLGRQALHRRGPEEPDHALGALQHVRGVVRLGDRPAVAEHQDLGIH